MHQSDTNSYIFCRDLKPENILLDTKGAFFKKKKLMLTEVIEVFSKCSFSLSNV